MRHEEPNPNTERSGVFVGFPDVLRKFQAGELALTEIQQLAEQQPLEIRENPASWISQTTRGAVPEITIGVQRLPAAVAETFGWGAQTQAEEYLVKFAHELSHVMQLASVPVLHDWLNRTIDTAAVRPVDEAYLRLYAEFATVGRVTGLPTMPIYEHQNQTTGNVDYRIIEDLTEMLAAYSLGQDYLTFRILESENPALKDPDTAIRLVERLQTFVNQWKQSMV